MDRDTAMNEIRRGLGFRSNLTDEIEDALIEAQTGLEMGTTLPWFLIQEDEVLAIVANTPEQDVPEDFIRVVEQEGPHYTDSDGEPVFLTRKPFGEAKVFYAGSSAAGPEAYSLRRGSIYIWPVPDVNYTLAWSYYAKDDPLTTNIENQWLTHVPYLLIGKAGYQLALDVHNDKAAQKFLQLFKEWERKLYGEVAERESNDAPYVMGRNN